VPEDFKNSLKNDAKIMRNMRFSQTNRRRSGCIENYNG
jgi:hypothetical protein